MPADTLGAVAKKAAMTGAVGGLAVAASGGDTKESIDAFIKSGGAVLVQAGQSYVKKNYSSVGPSKLDAYCITAVGRKCADAQKWYERSKQRLDELSQAVTFAPTVKLTANGDWAISWNKGAIEDPETDVPSVVLTYVGGGSPFKNTLTEIAALGDPQTFATNWVAFRDVGGESTFFIYADPARQGTAPQMGDILASNREVNVRGRPAGWDSPRGVLPEGAKIKIYEVRTLYADGEPQEWVRIQRLPD